VARHRGGDLIGRIEFQFGSDVAPRPTEQGSAPSDQLEEFVRRDGEAAVGVHVPDEAQRMPALQ
jgi:hypothetical protein